MLTPEDIRDLVRVLDSSSLEEFQVDMGGLSVTLRRHGARGDWTRESRVSRQPHVLEASQESDTREGAGEEKVSSGTGATTSSARREDVHPITPPLLGTFYRAPKPGAAPFVEVGAAVEADTVVGMMETMKMMSPVHAGVTGTIVEICVGDAEFAQPQTALMLVEVRS
jgi:acetyl-CoA carboxylase biotin carboxyl carrier protein